MWSRQRSRPEGTGRSTIAGEWAVSEQPAHPALVGEADFVAVQQVRAARASKDGVTRDYLLAGLIACRLCGRRMDSHWVNGRAGYRCRHGHNSARPAGADRHRNLYVREDMLLAELLAAEQAASVGSGSLATPMELVGSLRSRSMMIVHESVGRPLEQRR